MPFGNLSPIAPDPVLSLTARFRADPRPRKIDLGVGVYRDARGQTPVLAAVTQAERRLFESQVSKSYVGSEGDPEFMACLNAEVFGARPAGPGPACPRTAARSDDARPDATRPSSTLAGSTHRGAPGPLGLQTVGGSGALRLAGDLLARAQPGRRIWLALPTWPNHAPIFAAAGLRVATVDLFDPTARHYRPEAMLDALRDASPGDAVLLHGCCHNPTGIDPQMGYWERMAELIVARALMPLVDMAYQGLGQGWDEDGAGLRVLAERVPHLLTAYSCSKNFGLYRERVGALFVSGENPRQTRLLCDHLAALARTNYSMPPDHGAAVVRIILADERLKALWLAELAQMRNRLDRVRAALAERGRVGTIDLEALAAGRGMFATLPLAPAEVDLLQAEFGIYLPPSGRINIAGLTEHSIGHFVDALRAVQRRSAA